MLRRKWWAKSDHCPPKREQRKERQPKALRQQMVDDKADPGKSQNPTKPTAFHAKRYRQPGEDREL